jgi:hypothetical protein
MTSHSTAFFKSTFSTVRTLLTVFGGLTYGAICFNAAPAAGHTADGRRTGTGLRLRCTRVALLLLGVRLQHEIADALLRVDVSDWSQHCEAATLTVDGVLARPEGDVAAVATASFPDVEPDRLQAVELAVDETQLAAYFSPISRPKRSTELRGP